MPWADVRRGAGAHGSRDTHARPVALARRACMRWAGVSMIPKTLAPEMGAKPFAITKIRYDHGACDAFGARARGGAPNQAAAPPVGAFASRGRCRRGLWHARRGRCGFATGPPDETIVP